MSQPLISRNEDLKRLWDEGYDLELRGPYLLVKNVPYVAPGPKVRRGVLVMDLTLAGDTTVAPANHQVWFAGEYPCDERGTPLDILRNETKRQQLEQGLWVDHRFSNKTHGETDQNHYDKILRYIRLLHGPAQALDPTATPRVHLFREVEDEASVFKYLDTASGVDGIVALGRKLEMDRVAIVGLGGTGSYVLDLVAKTMVKEIHLFDADVFLGHNAFRAPGAASCEELRGIPLKVEYFSELYAKMRRGVVPHPNRATPEELRGMKFVFLCLDQGQAKRSLVEALIGWGIPFIDASMGVELTDGVLGGVLSVLTVTPEHSSHILQRGSFSDANPDGIYSRGVQIADLNALNAALAVIRWKRLCGFYRDERREHYATYALDTNTMTNDECA